MQVRQSNAFEAWRTGLRDMRARGVINARMLRLEHGLLGDVRALGGRLSELKIDYGPGYRLYFTVKNQKIIWLLIGGDKSTQTRDIEKARELLDKMEADDA